jgi:tetrapyrrole methylase family protein/MazG family protein
MTDQLAPIQHLADIVKQLLAPNGCPWDREQTHQTLRHYLIEETYEFIEAVEEDDADKMEEELGDLLFHVVFHSAIAEKNNLFTIESVARRITEKMIRRHPGVFGDKTVSTVEEVWKNWDQIKQLEKAERPKREHLLTAIPKNMPALLRAEKLQKRAARVGFDWDHVGPVWEKILEELGELREATHSQNKAHILEELGDLLFSIVNLSRKLDIDPEEALHVTNKKFIQRFAYIEETLTAEGRSLEQATLEEMDRLWTESKDK